MMMKFKLALAAALLCGVSVAPATLQAQGTVKPVAIQFAKGASSKVVKGTIRGDQSRLYTINVKAGQTLKVKLVTSNSSSYFNITAPGAEQALFIGSTEGNSYTGVVPSSGNYTIDVYLMRNAARRNETANYTLTVSATGK
jgi:hypothetical protein